LIPKIIHYCWFGNQEIPKNYAKYIEGWKSIMPDYQFKLWNESNSPMHLSYMQVALRSKCWANLSNYVRLHAVYQEGGIYLDTDVEIVKKFDPLLELNCFFGFESNPASERLLINNAVFGAEPRHPFIGECKSYLLANFPGSEPANYSAPELITYLLSHKGLNQYGSQKIDGVDLLGREYFYPHGWKETFSQKAVTPNTFAIHHWGKSWWGETQTHRGDQKTRKIKGKSRRILSIYKRYGWDGVRLFRDGVVRYGPFQGVKYESQRRKPETFAKLIGSFNGCIHRPIYELMNQPYRRIIVYGCNDGYYAAGFAKIFPEAKISICSVDDDPNRQTIEENINRNGFSSRVNFVNAPLKLELLQKDDSVLPYVIFSSSEKFSQELLKEESLPYLCDADIIAKNPARGEAEKKQISKSFEKSHEVKYFQERQIPVSVFQYLESTRSGNRLLNLIDRKTQTRSSWFFMKSRQTAH
jgi:hypothetical protein